MCSDVSLLEKMPASMQSAYSWSSAERLFLIQTLKGLDIVARLDSRKTRNSEQFKKNKKKKVHEKLNKAVRDQNVQQIRNHLESPKNAFSPPPPLQSF